jgi:thiol-disulfide isomerase/thioredoxin
MQLKLKDFSVVLLSLIFCSTNAQAVSKPIDKITIKGHFADLQSQDSLVAKFSVLGYGGLAAGVLKDSFQITNKPFTFKQSIISENCILVIVIERFMSNKKVILKYGSLLVEPNDTILISSNLSNISFSSSNGKIQLLDKINQIGIELLYKRWKSSFDIRPTKNDYQYLDSITKIKLSYLEAVKSKLSIAAYNITKIEILSGNQTSKRINEQRLINRNNPLHLIGHTFKPDGNFPDLASIAKSLEGYKDNYKLEIERFRTQNEHYFPYSTIYSNLVKLNFEMDSCLLPNSTFSLERYYYFLKNKFKGLLREKLVTDELYRHLNRFSDRRKIIKDALSYVKNDNLRNYLKEINFGVKGDKAFSFEFPDMNGNIVRSDSLIGKIVILDFWFTGCGACISLHPKFEKIIDKFSNNQNVKFVSINLDRDSATWLKSALGGKYTSVNKTNLLNVFARRKEYDFFAIPIAAYYKFRGCPAIIVINSSGNIDGPPETDPSFDGGLSLISRISYLQESVGN